MLDTRGNGVLNVGETTRVQGEEAPEEQLKGTTHERDKHNETKEDSLGITRCRFIRFGLSFGSEIRTESAAEMSTQEECA